MLIRVIVPKLEQPNGLAALLKCLDRQEGAPQFEVVIAENGSRSAFRHVLDGRSHVRIVEEATAGPGPARNAGAAAARGDVLAFTDSDCLPEGKWLSAIAQHSSRAGAAEIVAGDVKIAIADPSHPTTLEAYETLYGYRQKLYVTRDRYGATCNLAIRADTFAGVGPFEGLRVAEDRAWGQRASRLGFNVENLPEAQISTPARRNFAELRRKWDCRIGHDFAALAGSRHWRRLLKALALAPSPPLEGLRIAGTKKLGGTSEKFSAFAVMARIRMYRALTMVALLRRGDAARLREGWRYRDPRKIELFEALAGEVPC